MLDGSFSGYFGDGSDGNVTISSPTTLTRDMYYNNLTVNSTLTTAGFRIFVKETINGNGTITWGVANNASGQTGGSATSVAGLLKNVAGSNGGQQSRIGTQSSTAGSDGVNGKIGSLGSAGGSGGIGPSGGSVGGIGGSNVQISKFTNYEKVQVLNVSDFGFSIRTPIGSAGGGGGGVALSGSTGKGGGAGGGAGASGGIIFIMAKIWAGTFTIQSIGGNGANGGNGETSGTGATYGGGGGAGGAGGTSIFIYLAKTWSGSYALTGGSKGLGGTGGSGGGNGADGTDGVAGTSYEISITGLI